MEPELSSIVGAEEMSEAHLNALSSLGLSQYECKCLLASLHIGKPATIYQIAIISGVPRTKVYGTVKKLIERGLIDPSEDDPKCFLARSPKDALIPLLEKEERRIKQGLEALTELEIVYESRGYEKRADALKTQLLRYFPRTVITRKAKELFQSARKKVFVVTTANGLIRLSRLADVLFERSKVLGLSVQIFSSTMDEPVFSTAVQSLKEIENCTISFLPSAAPVQVILVDEQLVLFWDSRPDDLMDEGKDIAFLVHSSELAEMMEGLVRAMAALPGELKTEA